MAGEMILSLLVALLAVNAATSNIILDDVNGTTSALETTTTETLPVVSTQTLDYAFTCAFETGLCGWVQNTKDDFNWLRSRGATPSRDTGPSVDHTRKSTAGHYMYIEASAPRKAGDTAELNYVLPQVVSNGCLTMYYHMYGETIGGLKVETESPSGKRLTLMKKAHAEGNRWQKMVLPLAEQTKMIAITGVVGSSIQGDIAIDDVTISTSPCQEEPFNCTFGTGLCGWRQEKAPVDQFDWERMAGPTASQNTGPQGGRTGTGTYLYVEASNKVEGHSAALSYTFIRPVDTGCISLYYHMYGIEIGSLHIKGEGVNSDVSNLWSLSGDQGNLWHHLNLPIRQPVQKLSIIGVVGLYLHGDIAIDDITYTPSACPGDISTYGKCPGNLSVVADPATGKGVFTIADDQSSHQLTLPVGRYPHVLKIDNGAQCSLTLIVYDGRIAQRLIYEAQYGTDCSVLSNAVTKEMIMTSAKLHSDVIQHLCASDCSASDVITPELACENDQLVIRWPTDTTLKANVTSLPPEQERRLISRMLRISKKDFKIIISTNFPPIVYPTTDSIGSPVQLMIRPECTDGSKYNAEKATCE